MKYLLFISILLINTSLVSNKHKFTITYVASTIEVVVEIDEPNDKDILLLAKLINSEARDEPFIGKLAVGQVVINRMQSDKFRYAVDLKSTIYRKGQFDGVNTKSFTEYPNEESVRAARLVLIGRKVIPKNCYFYANPKYSTDTKWIKYLTRVCNTIVINNHNFYIKKIA